MKFIPDNREDFVFEAHPDQGASVEVIHRSVDDWRVYKNIAAAPGDGLRGLHVQAAKDEERGRSVYVRSGSLHVSGYDTIFPNGGGPPDVQNVVAGQMLETITSGVTNAIRSGVAVDISAEGIVLANATLPDTEWWCVHTPGFVNHDTTILTARTVQPVSPGTSVQFVFIDADITIHGERQSSECVVARHIVAPGPPEVWHDVTIHECSFYFQIILSGTKADVRFAVRRLAERP